MSYDSLSEYQCYDIVINCIQEANTVAPTSETRPVKISRYIVALHIVNLVLAVIARFYFYRNKTTNKNISYALDFMILLICISVLLKIIAYFSDNHWINLLSNLIVYTSSVVLIYLYSHIIYEKIDKHNVLRSTAQTINK